jgi:Tol biopolymer transport system component
VSRSETRGHGGAYHLHEHALEAAVSPRFFLIPLALGAATPVAAQDPAATRVELVGAGVISTPNLNETFPAIDPRDGSLWFSRYQDDFDRQTIYVARPRGDGWDTPKVAPFSGTYGDRAPRLSPDGSLLYFTSNRPTEGAGPPARDLNIWVVTRGADGSWSAPALVAAPVSLPTSRDMHAAITADGSLYFASYRPEGRGRADIYVARRQGGGFGAAEPLGPTVNDSLGQTDLVVSADGTRMIFIVTGGPGGLGGDDLYAVAGDGTGWGQPVQLPAPINSNEYEYGPGFSPDGRWLYFTSHRNGTGDIFRVSMTWRIW